MSSCKDQDPTLTPEWFEALISQPAQPAESVEFKEPPFPFTPGEDGSCVCVACASGKAKDMVARKCSRCGAYKVTVESKCSECEE